MRERLIQPSFNALYASVMGVGLAACASAPDAPTVEPVDPGAKFLALSQDALSGDGAIEIDWWTRFGDPQLTALVERALARNASLDAAAANLRAAQARLGGARLSRSYSTSSDANVGIGRTARDGADTELSGGLGLRASWEYDAFGRIEAEILSAEFDAESARQAARDIAVIVASETALAYAELRGAQRLLDVGRRNADAQGESLRILKELFDNGRATRLDIERAEAQYRTTLASLPLFEARIEAALSRISALSGEAPSLAATRDALRNPDRDIPEHSGAIVVGSPENLMRRRPDIRRAEAVIGQRLALGEAARARLFPTVTLNGSISGLFNDTNDFGDASSFGFAIGPSILWEGPDLRRVEADIDVADAQSQEALALYEQTVLDALSEAETALTDYAQERRRRSDLVKAAEAARRALDLARIRFEEGLDDYLDVLDAQRTQLDAEDRLVDSRLRTTSSAIAAYRSLGGIWSDDTLFASRAEMEVK